MRRPQFSLKTMLWLMACAACFCAGIRFERVNKSARGAASRDSSGRTDANLGPKCRWKRVSRPIHDNCVGHRPHCFLSLEPCWLRAADDATASRNAIGI